MTKIGFTSFVIPDLFRDPAFYAEGAGPRNKSGVTGDVKWRIWRLYLTSRTVSVICPAPCCDSKSQGSIRRAACRLPFLPCSLRTTRPVRVRVFGGVTPRQSLLRQMRLPDARLHRLPHDPGPTWAGFPGMFAMNHEWRGIITRKERMPGCEPAGAFPGRFPIGQSQVHGGGARPFAILPPPPARANPDAVPAARLVYSHYAGVKVRVAAGWSFVPALQPQPSSFPRRREPSSTVAAGLSKDVFDSPPARE